MFSGEARRFSEPSEFAAAIRGAKVDLTVVSQGRFAAGITGIDLGALRIQRLSESLPVVLHSTSIGGRATFAFHTQAGPSLIRDGIEVTSDCMVRLGRPQAHFQRSRGPMRWGTISLRLDDISQVTEAAAGFDLTPPLSEQIIRPPPGAMANLRRLHAAVGLLAVQAPELIGNSDGARGLEQILMRALVACLDSNVVHEPTPTQRRHQMIMQRFHAVLVANPTMPLYVLEIAAAVGASMRSLSVCCHQHLGMGPKKYLLLRRMHLARRALFVASPSQVTVTDVATRYGFWQFGRFAVQYKSLFGESPSVTLRRPRTMRGPDPRTAAPA